MEQASLKLIAAYLINKKNLTGQGKLKVVDITGNKAIIQSDSGKVGTLYFTASALLLSCKVSSSVHGLFNTPAIAGGKTAGVFNRRYGTLRFPLDIVGVNRAKIRREFYALKSGQVF